MSKRPRHVDCFYKSNPACGFERQHTGFTCVYEHNPIQYVEFHVKLDYWCGNVCGYCADRLKNKHLGVEVTELPPWKKRPLPPWKRIKFATALSLEDI